MDILSDFYKRYGHEGGSAFVENVGASLCLFRAKGVEVGLKLSFGATVAYRKRNDGRIVISKTDTNVKESINVSDIDRFFGLLWAEEIINVIKKLPPELVGAEMLLHQDVGEPELSPQTLCAIKSYSNLLKTEIPLDVLLNLCDKPPYYMSSLTEGRIAVVTTDTKAFMTYNPDYEGEKLVVIKSGKHRKMQKLPMKYYEREYVRINAVSGISESIGDFMYKASRDMLSYIQASELDVLFDECCEFSEKVRILPDLSGAVVLADKNIIDELILLVGNRYEKKTGLTPAFYISD